MKNKIKCAVLGSTGMVGQVFLQMLAEHPWFELAKVISSDKREGLNYGESASWLLPQPLPEAIAALNFAKYDIAELKQAGVQIVFSALPADIAKGVEAELREAGFWVFSNASAYRYENNVPILIPEVNLSSLKEIEKQGFPEKGFIITNSNCTTAGLAVALAPLRPFGISKLFLSTYQAISGAGYPGLSALDIMGNAIPHINGEEGKVIRECQKILEIEAEIYPTCVRIPVKFGHLETVWVEFEKAIDEQDILHAWAHFQLGNPALPTAPQIPVLYHDAVDFPQPKLAWHGEPAGMQVFTGRLRRQNNMFGFVLLANNIVRGAAGGSIINAEAFIRQYQRHLL
ncbi:aspartate-semialdehyde dehydrogenase [candidate division KSB1 bacterium]|nr:aspartate-semialdehyde dehydrogenase [candidate division KSB1 bacterium]